MRTGARGKFAGSRGNLANISRSHVWQKCNRAGTFDGMLKGALVLGTTAGYPSGYDFAAFRNEIPQRFRVFVINDKTAVGTESANLTAVIDSFFSFISTCSSLSG